MARALLLAASGLFCLTLGAGELRCRQCALDEPYIGCLPEVSECTPEAGQPCMTVNVSYEGEVLFLMQGCKVANPDRCGLVEEFSGPGYLSNVTCCSHTSFCNDWTPPPPSNGGA